MKKRILGLTLLALLIRICAIAETSADEITLPLDVNSLEMLARATAPEYVFERCPIGSQDHFGVRTPISAEGQPIVYMQFFPYDFEGGQRILCRIIDQDCAHNIAEADVETVNALMNDWNESHVPIYYDESGFLYPGTTSILVSNGTLERVAGFIRFVLEDTKMGITELESRAGTFFTNADASPIRW